MSRYKSTPPSRCQGKLSDSMKLSFIPLHSWFEFRRGRVRKSLSRPYLVCRNPTTKKIDHLLRVKIMLGERNPNSTWVDARSCHPSLHVNGPMHQGLDQAILTSWLWCKGSSTHVIYSSLLISMIPTMCIYLTVNRTNKSFYKKWWNFAAYRSDQKELAPMGMGTRCLRV